MKRFIFTGENVNVDELEQVLIEKGIGLQLNKDNQYLISGEDMERVKTELPEVWYYIQALDEEKNYTVIYSPNGDDANDRYVGSVSDYVAGGFPDPIRMTKEDAEELLQELDNYVRNEEDFGNDDNRDQALWAYDKNEWGFCIVEDPE